MNVMKIGLTKNVGVVIVLLDANMMESVFLLKVVNTIIQKQAFAFAKMVIPMVGIVQIFV